MPINKRIAVLIALPIVVGALIVLGIAVYGIVESLIAWFSYSVTQ